MSGSRVCPCCDKPPPGRRVYCSDRCQAGAKIKRHVKRAAARFHELWPASADIDYAASHAKLTRGQAQRLAHAIVRSPIEQEKRQA